MPRRARAANVKQSKQLRQKSLDTFFPPSSPVQSCSSPSPKVATISPRSAVKKRGTAKRKAKVFDAVPDAEVEDDTSSDPGQIHFEPKVSSPQESDEDDATSSPRTSNLSRTKKRVVTIDSEEDEEHLQNVESEDDRIGVPVMWKGKAKEGKRKRPVVESDSDEEPQPRRRKLVKGVRLPTPEDLLDEVDESKIIDTRLRSRDKRSLYLQNLERIKRKKRGESLSSRSSETDNDLDEDVVPFEHARRDANGTESEDEPMQEDEGLSGFIEDDGDVVPELPAEFSMNTYQDLMHHFKIICQLFVHLAAQKRKDRRSFMDKSLKDQYFSVPLQIARRKLEGMRDSLVASSVWRPIFKKTLGKYPNFEMVRLDYALPNCDACHLGGRLSTLVGRVFGEPYDRKTFLPLRHSDESESDDFEDEEGQRPKKEFHLGRFCAKRTRVYHEFMHWEYALFKVLSEEVEDLHRKREGKSRVFVRVAYAGGIKPPDDLTDADGIMSWLDERGIIAMEWHKIKAMMESATHLDTAAKRGDGDD